MKKRMFLPIFIIGFVMLFSACTPAMNNIEKVKKFPVYGTYRIVGGGAVTNGRKLKLIDRDVIVPALKKAGLEVYIDTTLTGSHGGYFDNYFSFCYKYYSRCIDENNYPSPYRVAYAFGYVDLTTLKTTVLKSVERTEPEYYSGNQIYRAETFYKDGCAYNIDYDGYIGLLNAETLEYKTYEFDCVYSEKDNCVLRDIFGEWMLYDRIGNGDREFYAINYVTNELADSETVAGFVEKYETEKKKANSETEIISLPYGGKEFSCEKTDERLTFTSQETVYEITMDRMREKSKEVRKVEEMGKVELSFKAVVANNGEIYLSCAYYDDGAFGMNYFSDATAVLCFLYKPDIDELEYIGWLRGNSGMQTVVKL